jgi:hypothetical protein
MLVVFYCIIRNRCQNDSHCSKCQGLLVFEEFSVPETLASAPSSALLRMAVLTFLENLTDSGLSLRLCIARVEVLLFHFVFNGLAQILLRSKKFTRIKVNLACNVISLVKEALSYRLMYNLHFLFPKPLTEPLVFSQPCYRTFVVFL